MTATAHLLKFLSRVDASAGWAAVERRFDEEAKDGLLHRSKFAKCIGTKELAFAGELFDALARRQHISGESISKPELLEFWDQISDRSFDGRLQIFMDMTEKDGDGRVLEEDIKEMIMLSANANNLTMDTQQSQKYARLMMEELDPDDLGYIQVVTET
uniref:NADPH oxidase Respiratory burst domain-containing protein n=1 Tax=Triticum urartu TaxID=4572 RepID=A0A8R7VB60_TRIUA